MPHNFTYICSKNQRDMDTVSLIISVLALLLLRFCVFQAWQRTKKAANDNNRIWFRPKKRFSSFLEGKNRFSLKLWSETTIQIVTICFIPLCHKFAFIVRAILPRLKSVNFMIIVYLQVNTKKQHPANQHRNDILTHSWVRKRGVKLVLVVTRRICPVREYFCNPLL